MYLRKRNQSSGKKVGRMFRLGGGSSSPPWGKKGVKRPGDCERPRGSDQERGPSWGF